VRLLFRESLTAMDNLLESIVARITAAGRVTPQDVMALRPVIWNDGKMGQDEADALFRINSACYAKCPEWADFFVEAGTAWLVEQAPPRGYVDDANALWLISRIDKDGVIEGVGELLLLVSVLERASNVPDRLKTYAVAQIENIVLTGKGPTRMGAVLRPGTVDEAEVALLRRIFFAPGSDGAAIISDAEASALFRIKDATLHGDNAPSWPRLFVQLVGNHLMAHQTYHALSIERAAELERFMDDHIPNVGRFLARMESAIGQPAQTVRSVGQGWTGTEIDKPAAKTNAMTADEAHWLKLHIAADDELDAIEKALLAFVIDESGPLPAEISDWTDAKRA
jgi:hypothetical protein